MHLSGHTYVHVLYTSRLSYFRTMRKWPENTLKFCLPTFVYFVLFFFCSFLNASVVLRSVPAKQFRKQREDRVSSIRDLGGRKASLELIARIGDCLEIKIHFSPREREAGRSERTDGGRGRKRHCRDVISVRCLILSSHRSVNQVNYLTEKNAREREIYIYICGEGRRERSQRRGKMCKDKVASKVS